MLSLLSCNENNARGWWKGCWKGEQGEEGRGRGGVGNFFFVFRDLLLI